jgi:predicted AAA+ superfamily ATPase
LREKSKYFDYFRKFCSFAEIFHAMQRKIEQKLINWKNNPNRMPLIVNGARQIGKTYSILEFGLKNYQNVVPVNLEKNKLAAAEFEGDISPANLVLKLESLTNERILPEKTLLFLDEIQINERL